MKISNIALCTLLVALTGCDSPENYVFRNEIRPAYDSLISVNELEEFASKENTVLLDVRLLEDYQANDILIPGASYMNPEEIEIWASALPEDSKVVVYCVAGRWVSQKAANYLSDKGFETYTLEGGIEAWEQAQE